MKDSLPAAPEPPRHPMSPPIVLDVACLCAAWCRTCDEYADTFRQLAQALPAHRYRWIDIEDEAELLGDVDVETFPTLLLSHQGQVLFAGPVLPRLGDAQRLVAVQAEQAATGGAKPDLVAAGLPADQVRAFSVLAGRLPG